jgi:hypothetical protein
MVQHRRGGHSAVRTLEGLVGSYCPDALQHEHAGQGVAAAHDHCRQGGAAAAHAHLFLGPRTAHRGPMRGGGVGGGVGARVLVRSGGGTHLLHVLQVPQPGGHRDTRKHKEKEENK